MRHMAKHTLTQAARLTGASRSTLYRAIRVGRITREPDGRIDTTELLRAGFTLHNDTSDTLQVIHEKTPRNVQRDDMSERLVHRLERELEDAKARENDLRRMLELEQKKTAGLIEAGQQTAGQPQRPGLRDRLRRLWRGSE